MGPPGLSRAKLSRAKLPGPKPPSAKPPAPEPAATAAQEEPAAAAATAAQEPPAPAPAPFGVPTTLYLAIAPDIFGQSSTLAVIEHVERVTGSLPARVHYEEENRRIAVSCRSARDTKLVLARPLRLQAAVYFWSRRNGTTYHPVLVAPTASGRLDGYKGACAAAGIAPVFPAPLVINGVETEYMTWSMAVGKGAALPTELAMGGKVLAKIHPYGAEQVCAHCYCIRSHWCAFHPPVPDAVRRRGAPAEPESPFVHYPTANNPSAPPAALSPPSLLGSSALPEAAAAAAAAAAPAQKPPLFASLTTPTATPVPPPLIAPGATAGSAPARPAQRRTKAKPSPATSPSPLPLPQKGSQAAATTSAATTTPPATPAATDDPAPAASAAAATHPPPLLPAVPPAASSG
ncbi:hypothetical protein H4R18_001257 [Coemansia javaensis]|uniref:Uncharacterized protein n=1 Tax=Coemansia javaensis TaxID=2761396 RepID=A0A9W8HFK1_9FUNG|nr:hypothetical protein H4R18_001257 [Coemansia javaensis]